MPRHPRRTLLALGVYAAVLLLIGLWPTHVDQNVDITSWGPVAWSARHLGLTPYKAYLVIERAANVALFVPLGVIVATWSRRSGALQAIAVGVATSGVIEILQDMVRPARTASWVDVAMNTVGAAVGAGAVAVMRWRR